MKVKVKSHKKVKSIIKVKMAIPEALNVIIGFLVSLTASIMNALGLNLLQLDHVKNSSKPLRDQVNECARPLWHLGLYIYIISQ